MYMIDLITTYDVVNLFSMENYESLRKLRVGVNRYTGVNWSTTTSALTGGERFMAINYQLWGDPRKHLKVPQVTYSIDW